MPFVFRWNGLGSSQRKEDTIQTPSSGPPPARNRTCTHATAARVKVQRDFRLSGRAWDGPLRDAASLRASWMVPRSRSGIWPPEDVEVCLLSAGGFEKRENVPLFVGFCVKAFKTFGHRAVYWATFNEPTIYTYFSYTAGVHAPGATYQHVSLQQPSSAERCVFGRYRLTGKVLMHLLQAHCIVRRKLFLTFVRRRNAL